MARAENTDLLVLGVLGIGGYYWWNYMGGSASASAAFSDPANSAVTGSIEAGYQAVSNEVSIVTTGQTRGERNNNPGNIVHGSAQWQGLATTQTDPTFIQFIAPQWGIRAIAHTLDTYFNSYGLNTVRKLITRWSATDQAAYVANVAKALGVGPDDPIDPTDPATSKSLVAAIIMQENGRNTYLTSGVLDAGLALA